MNVVKISNDAFRSPLAKLKENLTLGDLMTEQFKQANEGVDTIRKQYETIGNATLPHYKVICRLASGKFIETPNVKPRATMSQAGRIRLMYPGRCNA